MAAPDDPRLFVDPVDGISATLLLTEEGYRLSVTARHVYAGTWSDAERYEHLSLGEALDVIEATILTG